MASSNKKSSIHILHVDDDPSLQEITKLMLLDLGSNFEIDCACCVDEALKKLAATKYDVIISDYEMPQKDGLQFLKELRESKDNIPFILFTGKGREEVAVEALNLGADGYFNKQGSPETVYGELAHGIYTNVEHTRVEAALKNSEELFRPIFEGANDGIIAANLETKQFVFANPKICELTGYSSNELTKLNIMDIHPKNDLPHVLDEFEKLLKNERVIAINIPVQKKSGQIIYCNISAKIITVENQKLITGFFQDVTEHKKTQDALKDSEQRWATTLSSIGDGVIATDVLGKITFMNRIAEDLTGWTLQEASKKPFREVFNIVNEQTRIKVEDPVAKALKTGLIVGLASHTALIRKDSTEIPIDDSAAPIKDQNGNITGVVLVFRDRTQYNQMNYALEKSNERFKQVVEYIEEFVWEVDPSGLYTYVSSNVEKMLGYTPEEVVGKMRFYDSFQPDQRDELKTAALSIFDNQESFKDFLNTNVTKDGSIVCLSTSGVPIVANDGKLLGYRGVEVNVTERLKVEMELKFAANIFNLAMDSIIVVDTQGNIVNCNEATYKLRGYSKDEMTKMNIRDLDSPESAALLDSRIKMLFEMGSAVFESVHLCKDKTLIPVEIHARIVDLKGKKHILAVVRDISERRKSEAELCRTMDQLMLVNEKLGVVGSLTRHDVRNKLSAVTGYAYLLKKKHANQPDIVEALGNMERAVADSIRIFEFAKMYEMIGVEKLKLIDVEKALNEAVALVSGLPFKVVNDCRGFTVLADSFLRQLFYNFLDNSKKYGQKTTVVRVYFEKAASGELRLIYEDNGVGISAENKLKLFKEGFSTGGSTGFGLFLIRKMMDVYGWTISEEGEPGKGAKFVICLPPPQGLNSKWAYKQT